MQKINYQLQTDEYIRTMQCSGVREKLLLHVCCAPCSTYVLEYLTQWFDITVFFSNPNITDSEEYKKRLDALYFLCNTADFARGVKIVEDCCDSKEFFNATAGFEHEPEGGKRCERCFMLRLSRTAQYASLNNFDLFATTLTISPHKNADIINNIGFLLAKQNNIKYLPSDFKKRGGYQRSITLCREYGIYRQQYCGCAFSKPKNNIMG